MVFSVTLACLPSARIDAGSCESSVSRAARDVDVLDRLASAARASLMRVTVALERALMPALTYASVQKDVLLAVVSAAWRSSPSIVNDDRSPVVHHRKLKRLAPDQREIVKRGPREAAAYRRVYSNGRSIGRVTTQSKTAAHQPIPSQTGQYRSRSSEAQSTTGQVSARTCEH